MIWRRRLFLRMACWWYGRAIARGESAGVDTLQLRMQHTYCMAWLAADVEERRVHANSVRHMCRLAFDQGMSGDELHGWVDRMCALEVDVKRASAN